jgi:hypothetical protein
VGESFGEEAVLDGGTAQEGELREGDAFDGEEFLESTGR